jgi:hypothetical protein
MTTWYAQTTAPAPPEDVLDVLTDPAALARWSPVGFDIEEIDSERLRAGTHARVAGSLAGREVRFDVAVQEAEYTIAPAPHGSAIDAAITVRGQRGITKKVFASALQGLLAVGGLEVALHRLVREAERQEPRSLKTKR